MITKHRLVSDIKDCSKMITRPLLAVAIDDLSLLKYPIYCTPKYDGIRCLKVGDQVVTRNFKPQPNVFVRETVMKLVPNGVDGELVLKGDKKFNNIQSEIMSYEGEPDFEYHIFDFVIGEDGLNIPYLQRMENLEFGFNFWFDFHFISPTQDGIKDRIKIILPKQINNEEELLKYEEECLTDGFEGVMIRSGDGRYKCGRSTLKEGILLKMKRFMDSEAKIIGFEEKLHNENIKEKNELGLSKRSSKKANLSQANTLGALIVQDVKTGVEFNVGSGYDDETRETIWNNQSKYIGRYIKYKYQPSGAKDKPRFPVFLGMRSTIDF